MSKLLMRIMLALSLIFMLGSCERRPLVDINEKVRVRVLLNTKEVPNVTTGIYNSDIPTPDISTSVLRVMFYNADTKNVASQAFIAKKGIDENGFEYIEGDVVVYPGTYDLVCYNFDTPTTLIRGENNWGEISAYTSEISDKLYSRFNTRAEDANPRIYYTPDHLIVARESNIVVPEHTELIVIKTTAQTVVDTYYIQLRLVNGQYASDATAVLTDLAPSIRFAANERNHKEYAGTFFEMQRSVDTRIRAVNQDVLCATFNTFGKRPDEINPSLESKLYVTFNVLTVDGKKVEMSLNMDSIFRTPLAEEKHWLLLDTMLVIPKPDNTGSGFNPTVDNWNEEHGSLDI